MYETHYMPPIDPVFLMGLGPIFALWFLVGLLAQCFMDKPAFVGFGGALVFFVSVIGFAPSHHYPALHWFFWLVYLAFLSVYYAFPRKQVPPDERWAGVLIHGGALGLVIGWGVGAKIHFWANDPYGFFFFKERMDAYMPPCASAFGQVTVVVFFWFLARVIEPRRARLARLRKEEATDLAKDAAGADASA